LIFISLSLSLSHKSIGRKAALVAPGTCPVLLKHRTAGVTAKLYCLTPFFSGLLLNKAKKIGVSSEFNSGEYLYQHAVERSNRHPAEGRRPKNKPAYEGM
jgi:hypothetical protein